MTAVDRPDNGQDEGRKPDGSWIRDELRRAKERSEQVPPWARPVITRPAVTRTTSTTSARAGAGEQQREQVARWLFAHDGSTPSAWDRLLNDAGKRVWLRYADALLALLDRTQPDGDVRQHHMDADCWCQPIDRGHGIWDHQ